VNFSDFIADVIRFNREVVGVEGRIFPSPLMGAEKGWLSTALGEELQEFRRTTGDINDALVDQVDALVDLIVFATGGFVRMGLTRPQIEGCLEAVMKANFAKQAGVNPKRSGAADAVKPEGWVGPEARIKEIIFG